MSKPLKRATALKRKGRILAAEDVNPVTKKPSLVSTESKPTETLEEIPFETIFWSDDQHKMVPFAESSFLPLSVDDYTPSPAEDLLTQENFLSSESSSSMLTESLSSWGGGDSLTRSSGTPYTHVAFDPEKCCSNCLFPRLSTRQRPHGTLHSQYPPYNKDFPIALSTHTQNSNTSQAMTNSNRPQQPLSTRSMRRTPRVTHQSWLVVGRTCMNCREAKVKCSKSLPCLRCVRKGEMCVEAPPHRSSSSSRKRSWEGGESFVFEEDWQAVSRGRKLGAKTWRNDKVRMLHSKRKYSSYLPTPSRFISCLSLP